jgi:hypothetical protein
MSSEAFTNATAMTGAMILLIIASFALFQAVAAGQPLHQRVARLHRRAARLLALAGVGLGCGLLARTSGFTEAALLTTVTLMFVASGFVVLAAVAPRAVWGLALAAPVLALGLLLGAEVLPGASGSPGAATP